MLFHAYQRQRKDDRMLKDLRAYRVVEMIHQIFQILSGSKNPLQPGNVFSSLAELVMQEEGDDEEALAAGVAGIKAVLTQASRQMTSVSMEPKPSGR